MDYKNYHNEVKTMQRRCNDWLDDPKHPQAKELEKLFQKLEDDVQVQKNVHTIRNHLKRVGSLCQSLDSEVMSYGHVDELKDWARDGLSKIR